MLTVLTGDGACTGKIKGAPRCLRWSAGGPGIRAWRMGHQRCPHVGHMQLLYLRQNTAARQATSCPVTPARTSARLAKAAPEFKDGLADDYVDGAESGDGVGPAACSLAVVVMRWFLDTSLLLSQNTRTNFLLGKTAQLRAGRIALPKGVVASEQDRRWTAFVSARRCNSQSRGSIYDSVAGAVPSACAFARPLRCPTLDSTPSARQTALAHLEPVQHKISTDHLHHMLRRCRSHLGQNLTKQLVETVVCGRGRRLLPLLPAEEALRRARLQAVQHARPLLALPGCGTLLCPNRTGNVGTAVRTTPSH